jgi:hypothetical protein
MARSAARPALRRARQVLGIYLPGSLRRVNSAMLWPQFKRIPLSHYGEVISRTAQIPPFIHTIGQEFTFWNSLVICELVLANKVTHSSEFAVIHRFLLHSPELAELASSRFNIQIHTHTHTHIFLKCVNCDAACFIYFDYYVSFAQTH